MHPLQDRTKEGLKVASAWALWIALIAIDLMMNLPGPTGCVFAAVLAGGWLRSVSNTRPFAMAVLAGSCLAGFLHEFDPVSIGTRLIVACLTLWTVVAGRRRPAGTDSKVTLRASGENDDDTLGGAFDSRDGSLDTDAAPTMPVVPLSVRLIDAGIFPQQIADTIAGMVNDAPDQTKGFQSCVAAGLLTSLQAAQIANGQERKLRVGRYVILSELGSGAMGVVYRALDRERGEEVALKLFRNRRHNLMLIRREMTVIQELAHPNIVTALEVGESDRQHFIAMEIVEGETLLETVRRLGPIPEPLALDYSLQIARALEQAHDRGIIHRDIKPGNIIITPAGTCKLTDLGLSRPPESLKEYDSLTIEGGSLFGTIGFASPEQVGLVAEVDERTDIYALGSTLFFILTAHFHVRGETTSERIRNLTIERAFHDPADCKISTQLAEVLRKMLTYDPADRYQSIAQVIADLRLLLRDHGRSPDERTIPVIVAEDSVADFALTKQLLSRCNRSLQISHAETFAQVTEMIDHRRTDEEPWIVLLDLDLPDSDAEETIARIPDLAQESAGIIALAANDDLTTRFRCAEAGALGFVCKSLTSSKELERMIFATLSRLRAGDR